MNFNDVELYFISDIKRPHKLNPGVRWSRAIRRKRAAERSLAWFWYNMQILVLNYRLRRKPLK